ncbi:WD40 repeat domain-containing protein [Symmachiella dynata]|uniref:WD40 repeat domain-containing protein n=1 Tax=Symmachiella dynata TaxID=2527995 RepID=UPI0011A01998|nr:PD40 domain-containing protein [Symmachiella dynata]
MDATTVGKTGPTKLDIMSKTFNIGCIRFQQGNIMRRDILRTVVASLICAVSQCIALGDDDLDKDKSQPIATINCSSLSSLALSPDGKSLATVDAGRVTLWEVETGKKLRVVFQDDFKSGQVAFSPDGKKLAIAGARSQLELWDIEKNKRLKSIQACKGVPTAARAVAYSGNGERVMAIIFKDVPFEEGGDENRDRMLLYDTSTGTAKCLPTTDRIVYGTLAVSPNGKEMAFPCQGVGVWDVNSGTELRRLDKSQFFLSVAYSRDGKWIAAGGLGRIVVWDAATGEEKLTIKRPGMVGVISVAFSPDGRRLVAGEHDGPVEDPVRGKWNIWNVQTGDLEEILPNQSSDVRYVQFSANGKRLISANDSGQINVFDASGW